MQGKEYGLSAHIFRRDLRVDDNPALNTALESSGEVITCFAAEEQLIGDYPAVSKERLLFYSQSLTELSEDLQKRGGRLHIFRDGGISLVKELCRAGIESIFAATDYTPYSKRRDQMIEKICDRCGCRYILLPGNLINEPEDVLKNDGGHYTVFTPFFKKASLIPVREPEPCIGSNFLVEDLFGETGIDEIFGETVGEKENKPAFKGGRSEGLRLIKNIRELEEYEQKRDIPAEGATSMLSAHLRFGTVSVREAYHEILKDFGPDHSLNRQLYWRDFFTHIAYFHPHVFKKPFYKRYESLQWYGGDDLFRLWCEGRTGFPLVDAGMRELNYTGYMHNRVRMVAASFLTKDLHIDWKRGERYFASRLTDYDPSVNNGNWQWAASTGCDAQPYFRIFNPWLQQKKFDPDCIYIKKWIPELSGFGSAEIHNLYKRDEKITKDYPLPVVDHKTESQVAKEIYSGTNPKKL